ncbi:MAG TPA: hypothetical protein VN700_06610 [Vicinamibacterales bacterium]|nr:hypothetical protein [Vicinamibacterales bacterium]
MERRRDSMFEVIRHSVAPPTVLPELRTSNRRTTFGRDLKRTAVTVTWGTLVVAVVILFVVLLAFDQDAARGAALAAAEQGQEVP